MICDLIIDGNYILSKNTFTLHKNNLLFGALHKSLENTVNNYRKWYPFANVYLVSDSKEKSWRKQLTTNYKATRKKDSDIDWTFVYGAYGEFKDSMKGLVKVLEAPHVEGDDWISFLVNKANNEGRSTIIVSNDYDIKQIVSYGLDPLYINIMTNEMYNKEKLFLPRNYQDLFHEIHPQTQTQRMQKKCIESEAESTNASMNRWIYYRFSCDRKKPQTNCCLI